MLALLYDVHGNLPALEAVIEDSQAQGADSYLLGGDYALFGGWPAETVERLEELPAEWIRGNGERWAARPDEAPDDPVVQGAIASCRQALGEERNARLATLPASAPAGEQTRAWHASPISDVESFFPDPSAEDARLLEGVTDRRRGAEGQGDRRTVEPARRDQARARKLRSGLTRGGPRFVTGAWTLRGKARKRCAQAPLS